MPSASQTRLYTRPVPGVHLIISTHTARHLRLTLLGASLQGPLAKSVTLSIDNDLPEVRACALECAREFGLRLLIVRRSSPGEVRVGQVRNNGVRAILSNAAFAGLANDDWLYFLDGDSVAPAHLCQRAVTLSTRADLLVGGRYLLDPDQTGAFDEAAFRQSRHPAPLTPEQLRSVEQRHQRYLWQARLKPLGLVKMHKPKVLGASHGVTLTMFQRVNGYDESFLGAWREDDDFGRRVYLAGGRPSVCVKDLCVFHLWHPDNPNKRENWSELPKSIGANAWVCAEGLTTPRAQGSLTIERVANGRVLDAAQEVIA